MEAAPTKCVKPEKTKSKWRTCIVCCRKIPHHYIQTFSNTPHKRQVWIHVLGSAHEPTKERLTRELKDNERRFICYDHFAASQLTECAINRTHILKKDALPEPYDPTNPVVDRHNCSELPPASEAKGKKRRAAPEPMFINTNSQPIEKPIRVRKAVQPRPLPPMQAPVAPTLSPVRPAPSQKLPTNLKEVLEEQLKQFQPLQYPVKTISPKASPSASAAQSTQVSAKSRPSFSHQPIRFRPYVPPPIEKPRPSSLDTPPADLLKMNPTEQLLWLIELRVAMGSQ